MQLGPGRARWCFYSTILHTSWPQRRDYHSEVFFNLQMQLLLSSAASSRNLYPLFEYLEGYARNFCKECIKDSIRTNKKCARERRRSSFEIQSTRLNCHTFRGKISLEAFRIEEVGDAGICFNPPPASPSYSFERGGKKASQLLLGHCCSSLFVEYCLSSSFGGKTSISCKCDIGDHSICE